MLKWLSLGLLVGSALAGPAAREAHWVIRTSSLEKSLVFLQNVFGMRVLRHEENDEPCPITCNGNFEASWSKTMVGYKTEDIAFCFEVTYNYGLTAYDQGSGLQTFALAAVNSTPAEAVAAATKLGYAHSTSADGQVVINGPDGYRFAVEPPSARQEPFSVVTLRVADVKASTKFYTDVLKMKSLGAGTVGYAKEQISLRLEAAPDGSAPRITDWEGRNAISMPEKLLKDVYRFIEKSSPQLILHEIMELDEKLGTLVIAIIKDIDGYEICLVSSEIFDKAILEADDFKGPDWALRAKYHKDRLGQGPSDKSVLETVIEGVLNPAKMKSREAEFFMAGTTFGFIVTGIVIYMMPGRSKV